jgi:hypothetical protein
VNSHTSTCSLLSVYQAAKTQIGMRVYSGMHHKDTKPYEFVEYVN